MNAFLQDLLRFLPQPWRSLVIPFSVFTVVVLLGMAFRKIAFAKFRKWAKRTDTRLDDILVEALHGPLLLWVIILGIKVATDVSEVPAAVSYWASRLLLVLWVVSITIVAARLAKRLVRIASTRDDVPVPTGSLTEVLASLVVATFGLLALLRIFDLDLTPVLTALGVGGLAVALALQDTLANLFSGIYISIAGDIRVGDYVELESGQQGWVSDISWRSVKLRQRTNNLVTIPNKKLAETIFINYHLPEPRMVLRMPIGVSYSSDAKQVERTLLEAVANVAKNEPALMLDPQPAVVFMPGFGDSSLDFTLACHISNPDEQIMIQHKLRCEILELFRREGIEIPFPIRTIEFKNKMPE